MVETGKKVQFRQWLCNVQLREYGNGRKAIVLVNANTIREDDYIAYPGMEDIAVATINLPAEMMTDDEVIIKDYSENEGMLAVLVEAGIISDPVRYVRTGYVNSPVCKLLIKDK
jgi:hypothetical protein